MASCHACGGSGNIPGAGTCATCGGTGHDGGGACFAAHTRIQTPHGYKMLGELNVGDSVLIYADGAFRHDKIKKITHHGAMPMCKVTLNSLDDEKSFEATANHPVKTHNRGWVNVGNLRKDDIVSHYCGSQNGMRFNVVDSVIATEPQPVSNLQTQGGYTYVTEHCIAHSFVHFRLLRVVLYELKRWAKSYFDTAPRPQILKG